MNILIDVVPETVEVGGIEYDINTDFRISIMFELMMQDSTLSDNEKLHLALNLYYPQIPPDPMAAVERILWFYSCGRTVGTTSTAQGVEHTGSGAERIYSFEHDAEYIYAAFLDQYGIDLQDIEHLHWWKFRAMFKGLKEDNLISKIMGYRSIKINDNMTDAEKKHYREMKRIYALPDSRTEEEKQMDFDNAIASLM